LEHPVISISLLTKRFSNSALVHCGQYQTLQDWLYTALLPHTVHFMIKTSKNSISAAAQENRDFRFSANTLKLSAVVYSSGL
jgi:hypothetical protein